MANFNRVRMCLYLVDGKYMVLPVNITLAGHTSFTFETPDPALLSGGPPPLPASSPFTLSPARSRLVGGQQEAVLEFDPDLVDDWKKNFDACQELEFTMNVGNESRPLIVEICYCGEISLRQFKKLASRVFASAVRVLNMVLVRAWKALHTLFDIPEYVHHRPDKGVAGDKVHDPLQAQENGAHPKPKVLVKVERELS